MDIYSLAIGVLLLASFVVPVIYILIDKHLADSRDRKFIQKIASENDLKLDILEFYPPLALGLDSANKKFLVANIKTGSEFDVIDLKKVKKAGLNVNHLPETYDRLKKQKILHLSLQLEINDPVNKKEICLYDEDDELSFEPEFKLMVGRKWDAILHKSMLA
ncbi:hypothetical protein E0K83_05465 [Gramella sp. BOM4]|nr:hypothetical protein [Christiangramia bathymodioli]